MKNKKKLLIWIGITLVLLWSVILVIPKKVYYKYEGTISMMPSIEIIEKYNGINVDNVMINQTYYPEQVPEITFEFRLSESKFEQLKKDVIKENPYLLSGFKTCYEWTPICR